MQCMMQLLIDIRSIPISRPCFYGDVINKAKKLKSDTFRLVWF